MDLQKPINLQRINMKSQLKSIFAISIAASFLLLTGCATIFKGSDQVLTFTSEPDGATVRIDGKPVGVTPLSTKVKKNSADSVLVEKEGYRTETMPLDKKYDGIALLNIFWDLSTTDLITGAAYEYQPSTYHFKMKKDAK
jgi:PEGA domain